MFICLHLAAYSVVIVGFYFDNSHLTRRLGLTLQILIIRARRSRQEGAVIVNRLTR